MNGLGTHVAGVEIESRSIRHDGSAIGRTKGGVGVDLKCAGIDGGDTAVGVVTAELRDVVLIFGHGARATDQVAIGIGSAIEDEGRIVDDVATADRTIGTSKTELKDTSVDGGDTAVGVASAIEDCRADA